MIDSVSARFRSVKRNLDRHCARPARPARRGDRPGGAELCGKVFQWLSGGKWSAAWGWQELRRVAFDGLGVRWAAACDVPDLELLPQRYPGARTVEFHAALEMAVQHFGLWLVAALRRVGVPVPLERWADQLDRIGVLLDAFGSDRGGMLVSVACRAQ